jgi:hypothetical protein
MRPDSEMSRRWRHRYECKAQLGTERRQRGWDRGRPDMPAGLLAGCGAAVLASCAAQVGRLL